MKKVFLSLLATAMMTSFAFASGDKGKKNKSKKKAKTECCDKKKCSTSAANCDPTDCQYPVPACCKKA